jgi:hypothetical protein
MATTTVPQIAEDLVVTAAELHADAEQLEYVLSALPGFAPSGAAAEKRARAERLVAHARQVGRTDLAPSVPLTSAEQLLAAQRIIDATPRHGLTMGEALAVLAAALEAARVISAEPPRVTTAGFVEDLREQLVDAARNGSGS